MNINMPGTIVTANFIFVLNNDDFEYALIQQILLPEAEL